MSYRILYILNSALPASGATIGLLQMIKLLPRDQFEAYFVMPRQPSLEQQALFEQYAVGWQVVPMGWWNRAYNLPLWKQIVASASLNRQTWFHTRSQAQLRRCIQNWGIDLVYTNSSLVLDGALAAKLNGLPHIWHIKEWIGSKAETRFSLSDAWLTRTFCTLSAQVIVMSQFLAEIFVMHNQMDNVEIVYDGISMDEFKTSGNGKVLRQQLGVGHDQLLVGMAASLGSPWKRHDLFIEIAARLANTLPQARFAIFGSLPKPRLTRLYGMGQPWEYYNRLKALVTQYGIEDRFIWAGLVPDVVQMMDALDMLIHPSEVEPFGRIAIEAMAAGRPVVGPNCGGIAESVVDGQTGFLVSPRDVDAFTQATQRLLQDHDLRLRLGAAGQEHVARSFSVEQHVETVTNIYETILK